MASFSQGFLSNLGRPAMTQSLFDLGTAVGQLPQQRRDQQKRAALSAHDPSTYDGQIALLAAQIQQETDPNVRAQLGRQLIQMKQAQAQHTRSQSAITSAENLAKSLEAAGDPLAAEQVRTGGVTPGAGLAALNRIKTISTGVSGRRQLVKSLGLEGEGLVSESAYNDLSDSQFNAIVKNAQEEKERRELISQLRSRGEDDLADGVEDGIYTRGDISTELRRIKTDKKTVFSNRKRQMYDGKVVWTANVTPPGGEEFVGYHNGEGWVPADPDKVSDIPDEVKSTVSNVTLTDQKNAGVFMASNKDYQNLTTIGKAQAQLKLASIARRMIDKKQAKSMEEALVKAAEEIDLSNFEEEKWFFEGWFSERKAASDYINEARK